MALSNFVICANIREHSRFSIILSTWWKLRPECIHRQCLIIVRKTLSRICHFLTLLAYSLFSVQIRRFKQTLISSSILERLQAFGTRIVVPPIKGPDYRADRSTFDRTPAQSFAHSPYIRPKTVISRFCSTFADVFFGNVARRFIYLSQIQRQFERRMSGSSDF